MAIMTTLGIGATAAMAFLKGRAVGHRACSFWCWAPVGLPWQTFSTTLFSPVFAAPWRIPAISSTGYAFGYFGGGSPFGGKRPHGFSISLLGISALFSLGGPLVGALLGAPLPACAGASGRDRGSLWGHPLRRPLQTLRLIRTQAGDSALSSRLLALQRRHRHHYEDGGDLRQHHRGAPSLSGECPYSSPSSWGFPALSPGGALPEPGG